MSDTEVTTIPQKRRVEYGTYASIPVAGLSIGDLAYATDRKTLYRWNGAAWQAITIYADSGTHAAIPAAADLPNGSLYFETDTNVLQQVQAGAWVSIKPPISTNGAYTGNDTANRAIPHGLGKIPSLVIITSQVSGYICIIHPALAYITTVQAGAWSNLDVTAMSNTNFYVGNVGSYPQSANANTKANKWTAFS